MLMVRVFYLPPDCRALGVFGLVGGYRFGAVLRVLEVLGDRDFRRTIGASAAPPPRLGDGGGGGALPGLPVPDAAT